MQHDMKLDGDKGAEAALIWACDVTEQLTEWDIFSLRWDQAFQTFRCTEKK